MSQNSLSSAAVNTPEAKNKTLILVLICLLALVTTFIVSGLNVALPAISKDFNADAVSLNWIVAAYALGIAIFSVPFGRIADIFGIKKLFTIGIGVIILASILVILANSAPFLIIIRLLQGLGAAMITSTSMAMVSRAFPGKQRGRALGYYTACVYAGISAGPLIGGILTERLNWRAIFWVPIPIGLVVLVLTLWKIKGEWAECKGESFDYSGSLIYGLSLAAVMYGFSLLPGILGGVITLIGILGILGFLIYENGKASPILDVSLFKNNRAFVFSNLAALIAYTATAGITFLLSLFLQYIKGYNAELAGIILITQPVIQTILSPVAGRLSDRFETRKVASIGMAIVCLGLIFFAFLTAATPTILIILNLLLLGTGFALFSSPNINAIVSAVKPKYYAVASSVSGTMRTIGQTLSIGICMIVMAIIIGRVVIGPENFLALLTSVKIVFGISAFLCFLAVFASLSRGESNNEQT
jgi:EmrB/QacA subfamily drug resistance transporter